MGGGQIKGDGQRKDVRLGNIFIEGGQGWIRNFRNGNDMRQWFGWFLEVQDMCFFYRLYVFVGKECWFCFLIQRELDFQIDL